MVALTDTILGNFFLLRSVIRRDKSFKKMSTTVVTHEGDDVDITVYKVGDNLIRIDIKEGGKSGT